MRNTHRFATSGFEIPSNHTATIEDECDEPREPPQQGLSSTKQGEISSVTAFESGVKSGLRDLAVQSTTNWYSQAQVSISGSVPESFNGGAVVHSRVESPESSGGQSTSLRGPASLAASRISSPSLISSVHAPINTTTHSRPPPVVSSTQSDEKVAESSLSLSEGEIRSPSTSTEPKLMDEDSLKAPGFGVQERNPVMNSDSSHLRNVAAQWSAQASRARSNASYMMALQQVKGMNSYLTQQSFGPRSIMQGPMLPNSPVKDRFGPRAMTSAVDQRSRRNEKNWRYGDMDSDESEEDDTDYDDDEDDDDDEEHYRRRHHRHHHYSSEEGTGERKTRKRHRRDRDEDTPKKKKHRRRDKEDYDDSRSHGHQHRRKKSEEEKDRRHRHNHSEDSSSEDDRRRPTTAWSSWQQ